MGSFEVESMMRDMPVGSLMSEFNDISVGIFLVKLCMLILCCDYLFYPMMSKGITLLVFLEIYTRSGRT